MNTIKYFYEISKIPRESGNEEKIADFLCEFAKKRNLKYNKDKYNNVIITKYNNYKNTIILQAHTDMVCEKKLDYDFDFSKDSLELISENGYITANKTSLGADNGIAVAEILNILDKDYKVNIEAIFTSQEETTMIGAEKIDISSLKGNYLINMDGFEEGVLIKESASFNDVIIKMNYKFLKDELNDNKYEISLLGLDGGHSGFEIGNDKGNSCKILCEILSEIDDIKISNFIGGTKFNVIPSDANSKFYSNKNLKELKQIIDKKINKYKEKYKNIEIKIFKTNNINTYISNKDSKHFLDSINSFKNGVFYKEKYVTTSQNLGVINLIENEIKVGVRSSRLNEEDEIINYLKKYSEEYGYKYIRIGRQPGYYTNNQEFINMVTDSYHEVTGRKMKVKGVHITLETGFFMEKKKDLSIVVISPKIDGPHTINEKIYEKSIVELSNTLDKVLLKLSLK